MQLINLENFVKWQAKIDNLDFVFADIFSSVSNGSFLPTKFFLQTDSLLSSCHCTQRWCELEKKDEFSNKIHGHGKFSICMLVISVDLTCNLVRRFLKPEILLRIVKSQCFCSYSWKHVKQTIRDYHPVLFVLICGEMFKCVLFNEKLNYF